MTADKTELKAENLNSAYCELAELIGIDNVLKIHQKYRGTSLFFPLEIYSRDYIISQILSEYDGHNIRHLATKYGYTEKWIRKIIKDSVSGK